MIMRFYNLKLFKKVLPLLFSLLFVISVLSAATANAAGNLTIYTNYPGITAQPGSNLSFPLTISGPLGYVNLKVVSLPAGWSGQFFGNGMEIHEVIIPSNDTAQAEFRVQVPQNAKDGTYNIKVEAANNKSRDYLMLNIKIKAGASGGDKLEVQYPSLSGPDTATYSFRATLYNNSGHGRFYSLGATAPEGWQVTFKPAYQQNQITSLSLEGGKTQDLDVDVQPPDGVKAGKYSITIAAVSGNEAVKTDLEVVITGTYKLNLTTPSGRLNADTIAGRKGAVTLQIENKGSADLNNISFSAQAPDNWSVTFEPDTIDRLASGEKRQVTAFITPYAKAIAGDYAVNITASTKETTASADIRVTVHTSTLWGIVGVVLVIGVIAWVVWTFNKYGRR
ncbi:MAG: hypothetical protein PWQ97_174 [Tepidanaerobacteraceae bacterium]|nr:hypothetical protein [Tepidanaerobacteraceae bacterium]